MKGLYSMAIAAGILFGLWPLFMHRSGLSGNSSTVVFAAVVLAVAFPFATWGDRFPANAVWVLGALAAFLGAVGLLVIWKGRLPVNAIWVLGVFVGFLGGVGLLFFNGGLAKASKETVASFFVITTVVQVTIPALSQIGHADPRKIMGFLAAGLAAALLS